ncbi:MAG: diguanylate cyclase domain-containing protein [Terracidiphilus sp.]
MGRFGAIRIASFLLAFSTVLVAQQYTFRSYRQAEGLKNLAINAMTVDRRGFLWLATENGIYRFFGSEFERFGPEQGIGGSDVLDVVASPDGLVWVGTDENLYRRAGDLFVAAGGTPIHLLGPRRLAVEDARHLLVVDGARLYRLEHDAQGRMLSYRPVFSARTLRAKPCLANISSLSLVDNRWGGLSIWVGCGNELDSWQESAGGDRIPVSEERLTEWTSRQGLVPDRWGQVLLARDGTLWAAGLHHVAALPPGTARFVDRTIPGSDPDGVYGHVPLIEDPQGRILAPTEDGLARWNGAGWRIFGWANGMEHVSHIAGMSFDAAGDLWFASRGDGLYCWTGYDDWEGWNDRQGLPSDVVWAIFPSKDNRVYAGTDRGPVLIDPRDGTVQPLFTKRHWGFGSVSALEREHDGALLAGTLTGTVVAIDPKTRRARQVGKLPSVVMNILPDSSGRLLLVTRDGLYQYPAGRPEEAQGADHGGTTGGLRGVQPVDALLGENDNIEGGCRSPNGAIWLLGDHRLIRLENGVWRAPMIHGLPGQLHGSMRAISCAPDGSVWVTGDQTGTWRVMPGNDRLEARQLELPRPMRSLAPLAILADSRGWIWVGTDLGLAVWNGHDWRHLTQESGLIWNDIDQGTMIEDPDGSLWIGTSGGISHLIHPRSVFRPIPVTATISEISRGDQFYSPAQQIVLPWAALPMHFQVSSPTMRNRSELTFQYRIDGLQPGWSSDPDGKIAVSPLPPGRYLFQAMACNSALNLCSAPVTSSIEILPPWWRTWSFYSLCVLAFLLLLVALDGLRARSLRQQSQHLETLIRERTQELEISRAQLHIQATHDGLTGMLNRTAILRALSLEMERAQREGRTLIVALIDLDHFKRINDQYGHLTGDGALRWFAAAVGSAIRPYDHAGRYGGEEFLLVLTEIPQNAVQQRLEGLHQAITNLKIPHQGTHFEMNCSMGATIYDPADGFTTVEALLTTADLALYAAKAGGRNQLVLRKSGCLSDSTAATTGSENRC